jgi:TonB family protein
LVDDALAGGGGNPIVAPSDDVQKGDTLRPQPAPPSPPPAPVQPKRPTPKPPVTPPKPKPSPEPPAEAKRPPPKPEAVKLDDLKLSRKGTIPVAKEAKETKPADLFKELGLKPAGRSVADLQREQSRAQARELANMQRDLASALSETRTGLRSGFTQGTKVEVFGPGGEAYANYAAFVEAAYRDAWDPSGGLFDADDTTKASVTIGRSGHVIATRILKHSGRRDLDRSVQRVLDAIRFIAPFPEGSPDDQRTFVINFNLKAKRGVG